MDAAEIKIGTAGEIIVLDVNETLAGSEVISIKVRLPDDSETTWAGTPVAGSKTVTHTLIASDLTILGNHYVTPYVDGVPGETARIRAIGPFD